MVVPDRRAVQASLAAFESRWRRIGERALEWRMQRVDGVARRLVHPAARLSQQSRDMAMLGHRLARAYAHTLTLWATAVGHLGRSLAWHLRQPSAQHVQLASARAAFVRAGRAGIERAGVRLAVLEKGLAHLSPQAVLDRGYAIVVTAQGAIVQDAAQLAVGDAVALALAQGSAEARVTKVER
jgi:exodeoxyribonuclease VII large subunit